MYEYISGRLDEITPTQATVEAGGVGYRLLISLSTFSSLQNLQNQNVKVYIYHLVREDDEALFGFATKVEREVFTHLVSVNGVGPGSARMILSAMNPEEVRTGIMAQEVNRFKAVKGIGLKTAQRIILELKDKVGKMEEGGSSEIFSGAGVSEVREEAQSALVMLGFAKPAVEKVLSAVLRDNPSLSIEQLIKTALKNL